MRVIVTRPAAQAAEWVGELQAQGVDAAALPLIGIAPARDAASVHRAWEVLGDYRLVVFVSPNAVEQFFACCPAHAVWPAGTLAGSPGPGTTRVLRRLGLAATQIVAPANDAPQFDSEALWAPLGRMPWRGAAVLIVRGDGGREWLADTLAEHGARVDTLAAYHRAAPRFSSLEAALLQAAVAEPATHLWFFSSSEAIDNLAACTLRGAAGWAMARALATHPRIAERARRLGFSSVVETRPALDAVVACIQSWRP